MRLLSLITLGALASACAPTQFHASGDFAPISPSISVERFLQASNERDLHAMAQLFGDENGPVSETGNPVGCAFKRIGSWVGLGDGCPTFEQVELEMDLIAEILAHDSYRIKPWAKVPGRKYATTRVEVDLTIRGREYPRVPFLVVRPDDGRWLIQEVDLQVVTGARTGRPVR